MSTPFDSLLSAIRASRRSSLPREGETIVVSDTVAAAASAYEAVRNSLEYDEEHLMRRNAIRRILRRRVEDEASRPLAADLLRELIWARYLPNKQVPETMVGTVAAVFEKYRPLFTAARANERRAGKLFDWLLDVLSTEVEYAIHPPMADEALVGVAYRELKRRMVWANPMVAEEDRDVQLYMAVHRAVAKSNPPTLRFRLFTLYYPSWPKADPAGPLPGEVAAVLPTVIDAVERQLRHPSADQVYRLARKHAVVFHVLRDVAEADPDAFSTAVAMRDTAWLDKALIKAAERRYDLFRKSLFRSVFRAATFLFLTKMFLALLVEFPYERLVLDEVHMHPLLINIFVPPLLLAVIGLSARIPEKRNTKKILEEVHAIIGTGRDFTAVLKPLGAWDHGVGGAVFRVMYALMFVFTAGVLILGLRAVEFNAFSIALFLFFLSLVAFFGLKIRSGVKELVIVESSGNVLSIMADIFFLPIVRAGRWLSIRIPKINVFLFFLDFLIEAPFKAAIRLSESWILFLREKKEEIS